MCDVVISLIVGIISGVISGMIVSKYYNHKAELKRIDDYWNHYLWKSLENCNMFIPEETLAMLKPLGGQNSKFGQAIISIHNILHPLDNEEMTKEQQQLFENFTIAYREYNEWKKNNNRAFFVKRSKKP